MHINSYCIHSYRYPRVNQELKEHNLIGQWFIYVSITVIMHR